MEQTIKKTLLPAIPDTVPPEIKSKFNIELTNLGFQKIADEEMGLVYNEDNVNEIKAFLDKAKTLEKGIVKTHTSGKEDALKNGRAWDSAKNAYLAQVAAITNVPQQKYTSICQSIAQKQREAEIEKKRVDDIKLGIENNAVNFSMKIAGCETTYQLLAIERTINLEKTRKDKYGEFLQDAIDRFTPLNEILKNQKLVIKQAEDLAAQKLAAEASGDDEKLLEVMEKQEANVQQIESNKITVQEKATEQPLRSFASYTPISTPTVKPKRTTWEWEISDISVTSKKMPSWVVMATVDDKINEYLAGKKAEGIDGDEFTVAGIRFFKKVTY